jgi:hypothetical protein
VIAQRYDAKILTALLAVGDCIYFDLGTPDARGNAHAGQNCPQCIGSRQSPVARIRTEALLASSLLTIALAQQPTLTASRLLRWTRSEHPSLLLVDDRNLLWRNAFGVVGCDCVPGVRLRALFRRSSGPAGDPLSQRPLSATRMGER